MKTRKSKRLIQNGGYYSMFYDNNEKTSHNNKLGDSPWCNSSLAMDNIMGQATSSLDKLDPTVGNLDFIQDFYTLFHVDKDCICTDILNNKSLVTKIKDKFGAGAVGTVYLVNRGDLDLIMKEIKNVEFKRYLSLEVNNNKGTELEGIYYAKNGFGRFKNTVISVKSDEFSNQTIMHILLYRVLHGTIFKDNYVRQYDAFFCNNNEKMNGYNVMEKADTDLSGFFDKLANLDENIISSVLKQILGPLRALNQFEFRHSDLKCKNVFVQNSSSGPIFKIADYDKSSITWKGIRFYNNFTGYFNIAAKAITSSPYEDKDRYYFGTQHVIEYMTRHTHIPFYESYDVYTFIISLLMEPKVYSYFTNDSSGILRRVWELLWSTDDNLKMLTEIERYHRTGDLKVLRKLGTINSILKNTGVKLKKNINDVYKMLNIQNVDFRGLEKVDNKEIRLSKDNKICMKTCETYKKEGDTYIYGDRKISASDITWKSNSIKACPTNYFSKGGYVYDWDYC